MRYFRRLPPLLRVASLLGLLFVLASLIVGIAALIVGIEAFTSSPSSAPPADSFRLLLIGLNLGMLSGACSFTVNTYSLRFRRPDKGLFPLESWQSQVRAISLLAALPLGALVVALVLPLGFATVFLTLGITLVAAIVVLGASVSTAAGGADSRLA